MDYKEKLRLAKEALDSGSYDKETIEYIFPELKESEDEKVKKSLTRLVKSFYDVNFPTPEGLERKDILTWLEKQDEQKAKYHNVCDKCVRQPTYQSDCFLQQGERKPTEWSEEDKMQLDAAIHLVNSTGHIETANWLKDLKNRVLPQSKQEWSEEDKIIRNALIKLLETLYSYGSGIYDLDKKQFLDWLQKLEGRIVSK